MGATTIADIVTTKAIPLTRYRAIELMKKVDLYPQQFAVTEPNQVWCDVVMLLSFGLERDGHI